MSEMISSMCKVLFFPTNSHDKRQTINVAESKNGDPRTSASVKPKGAQMQMKKSSEEDDRTNDWVMQAQAQQTKYLMELAKPRRRTCKKKCHEYNTNTRSCTKLESELVRLKGEEDNNVLIPHTFEDDYENPKDFPNGHEEQIESGHNISSVVRNNGSTKMNARRKRLLMDQTGGSDTEDEYWSASDDKAHKDEQTKTNLRNRRTAVPYGESSRRFDMYDRTRKLFHKGNAVRQDEKEPFWTARSHHY